MNSYSYHTEHRIYETPQQYTHLVTHTHTHTHSIIGLRSGSRYYGYHIPHHTTDRINAQKSCTHTITRHDAHECGNSGLEEARGQRVWGDTNEAMVCDAVGDCTEEEKIGMETLCGGSHSGSS